MKTGKPEIDQKIDAVYAAAENKYGADAVARIRASTLTTFAPTQRAGEKQRPTWLHMPGLTARPWWAREQCGRLTEMIVAFEEASAQIRSEILRISTGTMHVPYDHLSVAPELIRGWKNLFFFRDYQPDLALLAQVPSIKAITDRFQKEQFDRFELFLSVLEPGTHIPPHFGGTNIKLTLHLPLWIPEGDCALRVDSEARGWSAGEMRIFDDSFDHEAWNRTDQSRGVLLIKAYHPELSVEEIGVIEMFAALNVQVYRALLQEKGRGAHAM
ncbi:MAG: aspartyl/asparaginyl beta-hydroxylase domain-containing protein [Polyangia bacterium]